MPHLEPDLSLELSEAQMRRMIELATDRIVSHIESLPQQPAADTEGAIDLALSLIEPIPELGNDYEELLSLLFDKLIPKTYNTAGPGYLAYIPGGGLFHSAVAELIAKSVNRYVGVLAAAPGLAQLEANVIRWFCQIVGYPEQARGFLTGGGSLANLSGLVTARINRLPEDFLQGRIYVSEQIHHSVFKAARLAGFPAANVRQIACDDELRLSLPDLRREIDQDRALGKVPFLVVASAGTTNTGAVDDLDALADLCGEEKLWLHVDAAYGGFFMLTEKGRLAMRGLSRADSMSLDPHKGFFVPYGTGGLLVRDGQALRNTHSISADYMPPLQDDDRLVDFCEISPELSRGFRGLAVWLPLKLHGIGPFRNNLEEKLALAEWAHDRLRRLAEIEIIAPPQLSVVAFRYNPGQLEASQLNRLNQEFLAAINRRGRVYLTPTWLDGRFVIRICVLSFRTHIDRMEACMEDIAEALREVKVSAG